MSEREIKVDDSLRHKLVALIIWAGFWGAGVLVIYFTFIRD